MGELASLCHQRACQARCF